MVLKIFWGISTHVEEMVHICREMGLARRQGSPLERDVEL